MDVHDECHQQIELIGLINIIRLLGQMQPPICYNSYIIIIIQPSSRTCLLQECCNAMFARDNLTINVRKNVVTIKTEKKLNKMFDVDGQTHRQLTRCKMMMVHIM